MPKIGYSRPAREPGPAQHSAKLVQPAAARSAIPRHSAPGAIAQRALAASSALRPAELLAMQRSLGNRAVTAMLGQRSAGGRKLPDGVRGKMESALGADFSSVRVHVGPQAEQIGASAFTVGPDIHFAPGRFRPDTQSGQQLLGHELTHVVQQSAGRVRNPVGTGLAVIQDPMLEAEADRSGQRAAADRGAIQAEVAQSGPTPGSGCVLQANPLGNLAEPKVFALSDEQIKIQAGLVNDLEDFATKYVGKEGSPITRENESVINLGTIELPVNISGLSPGKLNDKTKFSRNVGADIGIKSSYDILKKYDGKKTIRKRIKDLVLNTMEKSGQTEYLKNSGLSNDEWIILIDVHYYRDRPKGKIQLHKDTTGDTLFVNLNFTSDSEMAGPEYILNQGSIAEHQADVSHTLPSSFREDLALAREKLPAPTEIKATRIPANGVVSFVDELVHHSTPLRGRRTVTSSDLRGFLSKKYPDELKKTKLSPIKGSKPLQFLPEELKFNSDELKQELGNLVVLANTSGGKFNADEIEKAGLKKEYVDEMFEEYSEIGFRIVEIKHGSAAAKPYPVRDPGRPRLQREMSRLALADNLPPDVQGKRRFFRTWVRAVRR